MFVLKVAVVVVPPEYTQKSGVAPPLGVIAQLNDSEQILNGIDTVRAAIEYVALPAYSYTAGFV